MFHNPQLLDTCFRRTRSRVHCSISVRVVRPAEEYEARGSGRRRRPCPPAALARPGPLPDPPRCACGPTPPATGGPGGGRPWRTGGRDKAQAIRAPYPIATSHFGGPPLIKKSFAFYNVSLITAGVRTLHRISGKKSA